MINFRFHIVSLIGIFLALALGVIFGSTVVDRAIVDGLRSRINVVETNTNAQRIENEGLRKEMGRLNEYVIDVGPFATRNALPGRHIALVAMRGINEEAVSAQVETIRSSGAVVDGVLWLEGAWNLADGDQVAALRVITKSDASGRALRAAGLDLLAARIATGSPAAGVDPLVELRDAGFVTFSPTAGGSEVAIASYPGPTPIALGVGGSGSVVEATAFNRSLATSFVRALLPSVIGEVWQPLEGGAGRGEWLQPILKDPDLVDRVSTVDDLEITEGRVGVVLAMADVVRSLVGHYGYGASATSPLPKLVTTPIAR